ncbi:MAG: hypothetical protein KC416_07600, partial [Myxococcales bacterium]|nr:hypothetical protein [Myxococcales bacterium]
AASKEIDHIVPYGAPTAHRVGALFATESMIHDLNAVRGVLGNPSRIVSAHLWQDGFAQTCIAEFPKDVRANMTWVSVPGLEHYEETLRFVGPNKRVTLTFPSPYLRNMPTPLTIERGEGTALSVEHHTASFEEAFRAELEHFRQCLLQGTKPETTVRDGIDDALFIHKIVAAYA